MKLQTQIPLKSETEISQIDYTSKVVLLGSCFSENIGKKLDYFQFQNTVNPFGILFHPKAIETFVERVITQQKYTTDEFVLHNEQFHCFDAHSKFSNANKSVLVEDLNKQLLSSYQHIKKTTHLIITLGTAWTYQHIEKKKVVANCHKIPQKKFEKQILSIEDISSSLKNIEQLIGTINPNIRIIYTVSPVRHIKDGFIANQQSKSHLLSAIHDILKTSKSFYFPSYEFMMDELRDYRFYAEDMIHPNATAINYIWEQFQYVWIHKNTATTMKRVATIQNGLTHKPFNSNSKQHQQFIKELEQKKEKLIKDFPFMSF